MLKTEEIGKFFETLRVLESINIEIKKGEQVAIVGASGVGKTTLLRILSGAISPSVGCLYLNGVEVSSPEMKPQKRLRQSVGMIYQSKNLIPSLKVIHNVLIGRLSEYSLFKSLFSLLWPFEYEKAYEALKKVGLSHKIMSRADTLSGGESQKVTLARLLLRDPEIILADEPVSSLDKKSGDELMSLLSQFSLELGKSLIVSTHNISHVKNYFKRAIGLRQGLVMFDVVVSKLTNDLWEELYKEALPVYADEKELIAVKKLKRNTCITAVEMEAKSE